MMCPLEGWKSVKLRRPEGLMILRRRGALLIVVCIVGVSAPGRAESFRALDMCELKPVFMEDFDTMSIGSRSLETSRWIAHTPWNGDFGDAIFTDPVPGGAFTVADGILRITATKGPDGRWRSGLIAAADGSGRGSGVQYGYFEARMRLPPGPGTWPAFWLVSLQPAASKSPRIELDVIEYYGHSTTNFFSSDHLWSKEKGKSRHIPHSTSVPPGSLIADFHTYGARVDQEFVTMYLDRKPFWQFPTPPELQTPLFPLVNLALGSGYPIADTPSPSVLEVDYVHVYALDPAAHKTDCPPEKGAASPSKTP